MIQKPLGSFSFETEISALIKVRQQNFLWHEVHQENLWENSWKDFIEHLSHLTSGALPGLRLLQLRGKCHGDKYYRGNKSFDYILFWIQSLHNRSHWASSNRFSQLRKILYSPKRQENMSILTVFLLSLLNCPVSWVFAASDSPKYYWWNLCFVFSVAFKERKKSEC